MWVIAFQVLFFFFTAISYAEEAVLRVGERLIATKDIADFANDRIITSVRKQVQGFSDTPLEALIRTQLLVMEGEKLGITPSDDPKLDRDIFFAIKVLNELAPKCEQPSLEKIKEYYQKNIDLYSTPLFVRLNRISLSITDSRNGEAAIQALEEMKAKILANSAKFADLAENYSEDIISKKKRGDIGFIPVLKADVESKTPFFLALQEADLDDIIGPIEENNSMFSIYQVTEKKGPIADPFEQAESLVTKNFLTSCREDRINSVINSLKEKYNIEYFRSE